MTKEELREYRDLVAYISELECKLLELETEATHITAVIKQDMVDSSGSQDKLADSVAKIVEVKELINNKIIILREKEVEIFKVIDNLPMREQRLFYLKYIEGFTWEKVAVALGYSWSQIHRIHGRCLRYLSKKDAIE